MYTLSQLSQSPYLNLTYEVSRIDLFLHFKENVLVIPQLCATEFNLNSCYSNNLEKLLVQLKENY